MGSVEPLAEIEPPVPGRKVVQHAELHEAELLIERRRLEVEGIDIHAAAPPAPGLGFRRSHQGRADAPSAQWFGDEQHLHVQPLEAGDTPEAARHHAIIVADRDHQQPRLRRSDHGA